MPGLVPKIEVSGVWTEIGARLVDQTGTPVTSAEAALDGLVLSDDYTLAFTDVVAGTSATVTVTTPYAANPYNGNSRSVDLDGTTEYDDVVPGVTLVFSSSLSFTSSWTVTVRVGVPFGLMNAFPPDSGEASSEVRLQVENTGAEDGADCSVRLLPVAKRYIKTGIVFAAVRPFAEGATEKTSSGVVSPYAMTVLNVAGSGSAKTMDLEVDGAVVDVENLTDGDAGTSEGLNVIDYYRITDGDLEGVEFKLSEDAVNADEENLLIFSAIFQEIAPDTDGLPGDWGTTDVALTEEDQEEGTITAGGVAYFHIRLAVGEFGNTLSNPYPCCVAIEGSALLAAGWEN
jgi:hypothetical protein